MKCSISWDPGTSYSGFPGQNTFEGTLDHLNLIIYIHLHEVKTKLCFAWESPKFTRVLFPVFFSFFHLINEKEAGCLSYSGFFTTQCLGILISRYEDPIIGQPVIVTMFLFHCSNGLLPARNISAQLEGEAASDIQIAIYRCFQGVSLSKTNNVFSYLGDMNHHLSRRPSCAITKEPNPLTTVYTINIPCRPHRNVQWWNMFWPFKSHSPMSISSKQCVGMRESFRDPKIAWPYGIRTHTTDSPP